MAPPFDATHNQTTYSDVRAADSTGRGSADGTPDFLLAVAPTRPRYEMTTLMEKMALRPFALDVTSTAGIDPDPVVPSAADLAISRASSARMRLLASKHAGRASPEQLARLELLDQRLELLLPRVTKEVADRLEHLTETIANIDRANEAVFARLGLK